MSKLTGLDIFSGVFVGAAIGGAVSWLGTNESDSDSAEKKANDAVFKQVCVGVGGVLGGVATVGLHLLNENE